MVQNDLLEPKKCRTVVLFAQKCLKKHGLADKSPSKMQPNRRISRFSKVKTRKLRGITRPRTPKSTLFIVIFDTLGQKLEF